MDINHWLHSIASVASVLDDPDPDNPIISSASASAFISTTSPEEYEEQVARSRRPSSFISTTSSEEYEEEVARSRRRRIIIMAAVVAVVAAVIAIVPTVFPPTPSPSTRKRKRRFSELESGDSSYQITNPVSESSSTRSSPTSLFAISSSSSAKQERMTVDTALLPLVHEISGLTDLLRNDLELTKRDLEARGARKRLKRGHPMPMVQQNPMVDAILRLQEVDSDLLVDDQVTIINLFSEDHDCAKTYLDIKSDSARKEWIKRKLTEAGSG